MHLPEWEKYRNNIILAWKVATYSMNILLN